MAMTPQQAQAQIIFDTEYTNNLANAALNFEQRIQALGIIGNTAVNMIFDENSSREDMAVSVAVYDLVTAKLEEVIRAQMNVNLADSRRAAAEVIIALEAQRPLFQAVNEDQTPLNDEIRRFTLLQNEILEAQVQVVAQQLAQATFDAQRFADVGDVDVRLQNIITAIAGAPAAVADAVARAIYLNLLATAKTETIPLAVQAAFDRLNLGGIGNVQNRLNVINQAIVAANGIGDEETRNGYLARFQAVRAETLPLAAQEAFDAHDFDAELNLRARLQAIRDAIADAAVHVADGDVRAIYVRLLEDAKTALVPIVAQDMFNGHHFETEADLQVRFQNIIDAIAHAGRLHAHQDVMEIYLRLLEDAKRDVVPAVAQAIFNAHGFDAEANVEVRLQDIRDAIANAAVHVADAEVRVPYEARLEAAKTALVPEVAQAAFDAHNFDAQADVEIRFQGIRDAIADAAVHIADAEVRAPYEALLAAAKTALVPEVAQAAFDDHDFDAEADVELRLQDIRDAIANAAVHIADEDVRAPYLAHLETARLAVLPVVAEAILDVLDFAAIAEPRTRLEAINVAIANADADVADAQLREIYRNRLQETQAETSAGISENIVTEALADLPAVEQNAIQRDVGIATRLAALQAQLAEGRLAEAEARRAAEALSAQRPARTLIVEQTGARIASNAPGVAVDVKLLSPLEHGQASNAAAKNKGW